MASRLIIHAIDMDSLRVMCMCVWVGAMRSFIACSKALLIVSGVDGCSYHIQFSVRRYNIER